MSFFCRPYNIGIYATAFIAVVFGAWYGSIIILLLQCGIFLVWDVAFVIWGGILHTEDPDTAITRRGVIGTFLSYFLPFYSVLFGLLFVLEADKQKNFLDLCSRAHLPLSVLLGPFVISAVTLLFVPVAVVDPETKKVSSAFKSVIFIAGYAQKCAIILFAYSILRIAYVLSTQQSVGQ